MPPKKKIEMPEGRTAKLVTYSMDKVTLQRLDKLLTWMHDHNKSRVICRLIDAEYLRLAEMKGVEP